MEPRFGDWYNSVVLAHRPLALLTKIYGVHPMDEKKPLAKCCCSSLNLVVSTCLNLMLVLFTVSVVTALEFVQPRSDGITEYTTKLSFYGICLCAMIHMLSNLSKGSLYAEVESMWRFIDKQLGIVKDEALKSWGRKMVMFFALLKLLFIGTSAAIVIEQRRIDDFWFCLLLIAIVGLFVWHNCAILAPQFCYLFYCRAIQSRFAILGMAIQKVLGGGGEKDTKALIRSLDEQDIALEVEGLRHTYHLLAEITMTISDMSSPMILSGFLIDSGMICTCMYRLIQMWEQERWSVPLELMAIIISILKIFAITFLGSAVTSTVHLSFLVVDCFICNHFYWQI